MADDSHNTFSTDPKDPHHIPLLVDTMENQLNQHYAMWPERAYILKGSQIKFISQPDSPFLHEVVEQVLEGMVASSEEASGDDDDWEGFI